MYKYTNAKGITYFLNTKDISLNGGAKHPIYYFSKDQRPETSCDLPDGYRASENPRSGMVVLKKVVK